MQRVDQKPEWENKKEVKGKAQQQEQSSQKSQVKFTGQLTATVHQKNKGSTQGRQNRACHVIHQ